MELQQQFVTANLSVGLAVLALVWFCMRRKTKIDEFREEIFTLRDELFDYMVAHELPFDLRAYRVMREDLNEFIRVAPAMTPTAFILVALLANSHGKERPKLITAINEVHDDAHRRRFNEARRAAGQAFLTFLGPVGWMIRLASKFMPFAERIRQQLNSLSLPEIGSAIPNRSARHRMAR